MSQRVIGDALWRALCPSVDARFLSKAVRSPLSTLSSAHDGHEQHAHGWSQSQPPSSASGTQPDTSQERALAARQRLAERIAKSRRRSLAFLRSIAHLPVTVEDLVKAANDFPPRLPQASTPVIYEALRVLRRLRDRGGKIRQIVKYLVEERGERPNIFLYEALVEANCHTTTGAAGDLKAILGEMRQHGVVMTPSFYHTALKLLAVHPCYVTRIELLEEMQEQGIELTDEGKCHVALAMLRENQYEMALEYLDQLWREGLEVPSWVLDIYIYVLARQSFLDEALEVLHQRLAKADGNMTSVPLGVWYFLLDECSRGLHYEGTAFIWDKMVRSNILNPADGMAYNALNTASRHGDSALATEVIQLLSSRRVKLNINHYEALLDCYVQAGDLQNAFEVLCIMTDAGIQPDQSSTRSIFMKLRHSPELADETLSILADLSKERELPTAAVNVLLEALAKVGDMPKALEVYQQFDRLCPSGPNQQTFAVLIDECKTAEAAGFLASELERFSIKASVAMLDNLTRCFVRDGDIGLALGCLLSALAQSTPRVRPKGRTVMAVIERCRALKDARVWAVVAEAERRGVKINTRQRKMLVGIPKPSGPVEIPPGPVGDM